MKTWRPFVATACFLLLAACALGPRSHREFYVCAAAKGAFFDDISKAAKELDYRPSTGIAEDGHGHVTTVMKATRWMTAIWATNQIVGPALDDAAGEITPRHDAFSVSVDGETFDAKQVDGTYHSLKSKLSHDGYSVNDQPCPPSA